MFNLFRCKSYQLESLTTHEASDAHIIVATKEANLNNTKNAEVKRAVDQLNHDIEGPLDTDMPSILLRNVHTLLKAWQSLCGDV